MGNCWGYQANPKYYPNDFLAAVNYFRSHHILTPELSLDLDLCTKALASANLAAYQGDDGNWGKGTKLNGELIWVRSLNGPNDNFAKSPFAAPQFWYNEVTMFKFENGENDVGMVSNFLTLIWRKTRRVGVGVALNKAEDKIYVVAKFDGKYGSTSLSDISSNVKRPINGLPAPKIDIFRSPEVVEKGKLAFKIHLRDYSAWCKENLTIGSKEFCIQTYLKNNEWSKDIAKKAGISCIEF